MSEEKSQLQPVEVDCFKVEALFELMRCIKPALNTSPVEDLHFIWNNQLFKIPKFIYFDEFTTYVKIRTDLFMSKYIFRYSVDKLGGHVNFTKKTPEPNKEEEWKEKEKEKEKESFDELVQDIPWDLYKMIEKVNETP